MSDASCHCPFLNRADERCAQHLSLDQLPYALRHCFDRYNECPTYVALLVERQVRRAGAGAPFHAIGESRAARPVVQVTVSVPRGGRGFRAVAAPEGVPVVSGV